MARSVTGCPAGNREIIMLEVVPADYWLESKKKPFGWGQATYLDHFIAEEFGQSACGCEARRFLFAVVFDFARHRF